MLYLIGADPLDETAEHRNLDKPLQAHFAQCLKNVSNNRPQNAWTLLAEYVSIIEKLCGSRTFRVFYMPYKT